MCHGTSRQWASCQIRKIAGAHAPGMPGTFSPRPQVSDPDMHHGTCVTHVPWCMPGSLTSGFLWNRRRGKTFPAFPAHAHPQFCVSGKRPMMWCHYHDYCILYSRCHQVFTGSICSMGYLWVPCLMGLFCQQCMPLIVRVRGCIPWPPDVLSPITAPLQYYQSR